MIVDQELEPLQHYATSNAKNVKVVMEERHLSLQDPKTFNILLRAPVLPHGTFRRKPPMSIKTTKTRLKDQYTQMAQHSDPILDFDPEEHSPLPARALQE